MKKPILIVLISCFCFSVGAQEAKKLGIEEAIRLSIGASKNLKISKADIERAKAKLAQARDQQIPSLGISGTYYRLNTPDISIGRDLQSALSKATQGSGNTSGSGSEPSKETSPSFSAPKQAILAQASLSESIFEGFKVRSAIASEKYLLRASELTAEHDKSEVAVNTTEAFYNIYKLEVNKGILERDLDEQAHRVTDFSNKERNGLLTRNDLLKAKVQEANVKLSLLDVSNNLEIALYNFKIMLALPDSSTLELDTASIFHTHEIKAKEEYIQDALATRLDLQAQGQQTESYKAGLKSAKSAYYPSVGLTGGYINAWLPKFVNINNALMAGLSLKYNLTSILTTKHKVQEAKAGLNSALANYDQLSDNIKMAVNKDYMNYKESLQKIELSASTIEQAAENYRILKNKYANSLSTLTDLLDGEVALLQAQINLAGAKADAEVAYYKLIESSGK